MRASILFWMLGATDGHGKNFSIALGPGGGFRLTPLYDVLTAQPSLDAGEIPKKKFKLAMSVGKNRHYQVEGILPRHFLQTAELCGVGAPLMRRIFQSLAGEAAARTDAVLGSLPRNFPDLAASVGKAMRSRARILTEFDPLAATGI